MRKLILMRGVSGAGKSTLINKLQLETNTLSPDVLRCMMSGLEIFEDGLCISQKDNSNVFKEMFAILDKRMEYGLLTVIDATNISERQIEKFRGPCNKHNYECVVVDFEVELKELLKRNDLRGYKKVPEDMVVRMYKDKISQRIPSFCKVISPEQLENEIQFKYIDISKYKKVVHIGDIHGCATVLKNALSSTKFDTFYIFCGDYIDRGLQNVETLKYLLTLKSRPNVVFLKGNHELNLIRYVNGEETFGKAFEKTKTEIEDAEISLKELKAFCKQLKTYFAYSHQGKKVICTHGGISNMKNLNIVSEHSFVVGSGDVEADIDSQWEKNTAADIYQVHGHRNPNKRPISVGLNSFNLEGEVEYGGYLRVLELTERGFQCRTYKNNIFTKDERKESKETEDIEAEETVTSES